jgi:hypothetical protein
MERQQEKEARLDAFLETTRARVGKDKEPGSRVVVVKAKGAAGMVDELFVSRQACVSITSFQIRPSGPISTPSLL